MDASIVVVGDEILSGHVRDANAHFIATRLASHGHALRRVAIVSDDPADIADAIRRDMADEAIRLVFVCGGLGPTHDDRTMEGVAAALGIPLEPCAPIAERIAQIAGTVQAAAFEGDPLGMPGLHKMALAPAGAQALQCASGVIPAVTMESGAVRLVVLPGPPRELEAVFRETVEPRFLEGTGASIVRAEIEHPFPESALAAALAAAEAAFPSVKIGSYPMPDRVLIRIAGSQETVEGAIQAVRAAIDQLSGSDDGRRLLDLMRSRRQG